jgi:DNA-binding NarL/FixJ family response regulator
MTSALLAPGKTTDEPRPDVSGQLPIGRAVLIDPRPERRAILALLVERSPRLTVVGLAGTLAEAEAQIRTERADVAILEIQMPVEQGLTTIAALRDMFPDLRIAACSFHSDSATREAAMLHGADGYLMKPLQLEALVALVFGAQGLPQPAR